MKELSLHINDHLCSILIGEKLLHRLAREKDTHMICLVDENVHTLHKEKFSSLNCILIPEGEKQKSISFLEKVYRELLAKEADRKSMIIGIGGGLVTDLAGFVASTYMRGLRFGFISTTLLGQVDASIGGKNGVNLDGYKNMIGLINQPEFVWCDLDLLRTLPPEELASGFAEVIKYGAIRDRILFEKLEEGSEEILLLEMALLEEIIATSASIKISIVEADVNEMGERKLLNFGHTLGHAIERLSGMMHGEAIAIGMVLASKLSVKLGFLRNEEAKRLESLIEKAGLPVSTDIPMSAIYDSLLKDKKRAGTKIHFILLKELGEAFIHSLELSELKAALDDLH